MEFGLSPQQVQLADTVRRYLSDQCPTDRVRAVMEGDSGHDAELWRGLMDLGVGALAVPEDDGGLGAEFLDLALVSEQMGFACAPGPFLPTALATIALACGDNPEARAQWLPRLMAGEAIGTVAVGEAGGRWDCGELRAQFEGGKLHADKSQVPYGALADVHVVAVRDGNETALVLADAACGGVSATPLSGNDRSRRLDAVEYRTGAVRVGGQAAFEKVRDSALVLLAADAFGGARRCLEMASTYALQREQFGQPIGAFQAVKHQLANLAVELEPALSLWWYAAHALDRIPDQAARHAAMAKAHLADLFDRAARDSTELHGGIGFTWEFDLHLWLRRALFDRSHFGDAHYHRARAARLAGW